MRVKGQSTSSIHGSSCQWQLVRVHACMLMLDCCVVVCVLQGPVSSRGKGGSKAMTQATACDVAGSQQTRPPVALAGKHHTYRAEAPPGALHTASVCITHAALRAATKTAPAAFRKSVLHKQKRVGSEMACAWTQPLAAKPLVLPGPELTTSHTQPMTRTQHLRCSMSHLGR
jgi:hypothetical protein